MPAKGGEPEQITLGTSMIHTTAWSPDGDYIAYTEFSSGSMDIWTVPSLGGRPTRVTTERSDEGAKSAADENLFSEKGDRLDGAVHTGIPSRAIAVGGVQGGDA